MSHVPDQEQYRKALHAWELSIPKKYRQMLVAHYEAPDHTATAEELAGAVKYPDYNTINLQYGLCSKELARRMRWTVPEDAQDSYMVASFIWPDEYHPHTRWVMHPPSARAIRDMQWSRRDKTAP